jgi:putative effector of murein hydrolase
MPGTACSASPRHAFGNRPARVAVAIAEKNGGSGELAILAVFLTGLVSVMMAPAVFRLFLVRDEAAQGFVLG